MPGPFRLPAFCAAPLLLATVVLSAPAAEATPAEFIRETSNHVFSSLGEKDISETEYSDRFRQLLNKSFDLPYIGRFVLGRYWRVASAQEKEEFGPLFERFLVQVYSNRFRDLTNRKLTILRSVELSKKSTVVLTQIELPDRPPVKVDWRVRKSGPEHKIIDVVVEGLSMSVTQRDEFAAVIRRGGGKVTALLRALRRKTG